MQFPRVDKWNCLDDLQATQASITEPNPTPEQIERHQRAHSEARGKAQKLGIYVYCPGDPLANIGLFGLVYGPSGEVAAVPPSDPGKSDFLKLIELANEAITLLRCTKEIKGADHCEQEEGS